ncbi:MAG: response regulator [FCB group bacterium]|nr:response regulator [FCB group bacterium]
MTDNPIQLKALLVDDEIHLLDILKQVMEALGIQAFLAEDGEAALEIYKKEKPDLVISDIYMPKMNGISLLKEIKAYEPEKPVVLITGYAHYKQLIGSLETGPDGFLEKPFDLSKLIELIYDFFPALNRKY